MSASRESLYDSVDLIRERVGMLELLSRDGIVMRRSGAYWVGLCPFHEEKSGSFSVGSRLPGRATCYGCGWKGDIFDYWRASRGTDFGGAVRDLGAIAGVVVSVESGAAPAGVRRLKNVGKVPVAATAAEVLSLPRLRGLSDGEIEELAALRGLSVAGVELAARGMKQVGAAVWPQFERHPGDWVAGDGAGVCWVVTDGMRSVAQFRRLDGGQFQRRDGKALKCWTKGSPTWPVGTADIGGKPGVILVEGGADLLAGWHFVWAFGLHREVGVVAMLGAGCRIAPGALGAYRGKRVRIFMDADVAGQTAALRWQGQLTEAGAAVEVFDLSGLMRADGLPVKDLNDLALCPASVLGEPGVREGFVVWDF